jgi:peptide/nickel transport system substrate-binding protein
MKKLLVVLAVFFVTVSMFAATDYAIRDYAGNPGGVLNIGTLGDPKTFNIVWAQETSSTDMLDWIGYHETTGCFIGSDQGGMQTVPLLATDWWFSEDGKTAYFELREGVLWSDGEPLTMEDVLFTFNDVMFINEMTANGNSSYLDANDVLPVVELVDEKTISFTWTIPNVWGWKAVGATDILPKHALAEAVANGTLAEKWTVDQFTDVVGCGPYVPEEFVPGVYVKFVKNPLFWMKDSNGYQLPYLDEIIYTIVGDQNAELLKFEAGELDEINPTAENFPRLAEKAEEMGWNTVVGGVALGSNFITFNFNAPDPVKKEWFRNADFRKAWVYALDRASIIETIYNGLGAPLYGPVSPSSGFYNPEIEEYGYKYSITRARLSLKKGGFSWKEDGTCVDANGNPVEFELLTNAGNTAREAIGSIMASAGEKLGIKVNFTPIDFNTVVSKLQEPSYEAVIIGLTGSVDPGSGWNVYRIDGGLHMWNYPPEYSEVVSPEEYILPDWEKRVDEIFREQTAAVDEQDRYDLFAEYQDIFANEQPLVFTIAQNYLLVYDNTLMLANDDPNPAAGAFWQREGIYWK